MGFLEYSATGGLIKVIQNCSPSQNLLRMVDKFEQEAAIFKPLTLARSNFGEVFLKGHNPYKRATSNFLLLLQSQYQYCNAKKVF